jgi:hypothetical protein
MELALFLFIGMVLQWGLAKLLSSPPRCADCGAEAMPATHLALVRAHHRLEKCEIALRRLYDETADYIIVNNLGPVHHNKSMQLAREALRYSSRATVERP